MLLQIALFCYFWWLSNISLCIYVAYIYASIDGHLGCFHVLAIVQSTAVNIEVPVSFIFFIVQRNLTGLFIIAIKLNCWNLFTETFWLSLMLYVPAFILKIHTQMKMEKLPIPDFCPLFSTCNHILRYLLTPWKKNI